MATTIHPESPRPGDDDGGAWGSDAVAAVLRALEIPYLALNPGASFRGLHDSVVNFLGNANPQLLLCLHEESAVAIAHGYAKTCGRAMAVALHSNVGLMHASMSVFNAWCDRVPLLLIGATGPMDAARRRPWIEWIHTARDQGALVRDFTKWDDQPASAAAAQEAVLRAWQIAHTAPCGPTYVCLDVGMQEARLDSMPPSADVRRFRPAPAVAPGGAALGEAVRLLSAARRPVILAGRVSRSETAWRDRIVLAERLGARVLTDLKAAAAFPTDHPLHAAPPALMPGEDALRVLRDADTVLSLDWIDLAGTLAQAWGATPVASRVIQASCDAHLHRGWSMDYQGLPPVDAYLMCEPDAAVPLLLQALPAEKHARSATLAQPACAAAAPIPQAGEPLSLATVAQALDQALGGSDICLARVPLGWHGGLRAFRHPLDYLGLDGGGGLGSGPGMAVGAALALAGSGRLTVALLGDGDFLMGATALWTATHYRIPLLVVVCNNRSFFNDEMHQERVARARARPVENRWIGQRIDDPAIDIAGLARAQGAIGTGPVATRPALQAALAEAVAAVRAGAVCVIDALTV